MFDLALRFDTDDPQFARGFEAGRIHALAEAREYEALREQPFHAANAEMVLRIIERFELPLRAEFSTDDGWMVLVDG